MGKADNEAIKLFRNNVFFADVFTYMFWKNGVNVVVDPNDLYDMDGKQIVDVVNGRSVLQVQRERDVVKLWRLTVDNESVEIPLILGLELQDYIHYALPVKVMMYDALTYAEQVGKASSSDTRVDLSDEKGVVIVDPNEFLSGFPKDRALVPPITVTLYLGDEQWDAPLSINAMWNPIFNKIPDLRDKMLQNYNCFFINPYEIDDSELQQFKTQISSTLLMLKYRRQKQKLLDSIGDGPLILCDDVMYFLRVHGYSTIKITKGGTDVCQAIRELTDEASAMSLAKAAVSCMKFFGISEEIAFKGVGIPEDQWDMYRELVEQVRAEQEDT